MKRYIVDIDGVCADFTTPFRKLLEDLSGTKPEFAVDLWDWDDKYFPGYSKQAWNHVRNVNRNWWLNLKPLEGFHKLSFLANQGALEPIFLTNRNFNSAEQITSAWLEEQGLRKPIVLCVKDKSKVASGIQFNAVIDDSPTNITDMLRVFGAGPESPTIYMVKYPYNTYHHDSRYVKGVNSLDEFLKLEGF